MPTRRFTVAELAAMNVPPDDPNHIDYDEHVLADEQVAVLKYTAKRRCVFEADNGRTYAVEYEAELDTRDFEIGGGMPHNHGWYGNTVEAVEVEERLVTVMRWLPVE
ncbi:hypothetical protein [Streptomyces sp. NPDC088812]|uniref:hypothetical protein n=1 Tax=Streptomyces sp. NPDC088812 TaxID=3365905 RepID=UPI0038154257